MQDLKSTIEAGNPKGYKDNPNYKAFDHVEKALKKRKRELEQSSTNVEKSQGIEDNSTNDGDISTLSQGSDQVSDEGQAAELQQGTLTLDRENPAFKAATEQTMQALEKTGVEVVMATPEMVQAVMGNENAERQAVNDGLSRLERISKIITGWLKNNTRGRSIEVELPVLTQRKIRAKMGRDFDSHVITANNVAHSKKNHGINGEKITDNSIPLRDEDFALMPYVMIAPDRVERGSFDTAGRESIRFYKNLSNGYVVVVEKEQKNSPDDMETITMWAELSANVPNARNMRPSNSTSKPANVDETDARTVIISPDDVAKIRKDAENAILNDIKIEKSRAAAPFYSNARRAVLDIKQEKATPGQWVAMLKKNGGLKAGEDAWVGLEAWLGEQTGTVNKQEVLDYLTEHSIQIEEVEYSQFGYGLIDEAARNLEAETKSIGWNAVQEKYPGIEEYFEFDNGEILWSESLASVGEYEDFILDNGIVDVNSADNAINETREKYTTEGLERKREIALVVPTIEPYNASDEVHFGDAGGGRAVAWVRFGETTDSEGNRVLVIDEIQSKRHQDGREKGYKTNEEYEFIDDGVITELRYNGRSYFFESSMPRDSMLRSVRYEADITNKDGVPSAPFEKNWHELAMKRMLRLAAEEGFDKVAWTTGEQQADRYDIGTKINHIHVIPSEEERYVSISPINGRMIETPTEPDSDIIVSGEYKGKSLSEVYGKTLADRIMSVETGSDKRIAGDGLRIGGEGMKGFYDRMLPSFVNKYTKKWGAKVGEVSMPGLKENNTMHSVDVTPAMAESVMQGQPMFLRTPDGTVYGWTVGGRIYLTPRVLTRILLFTNTPTCGQVP